MRLKNDRSGKILGIIILIILIAAVVGFIKINSMVGEQLRITITPEYFEANASDSGKAIFAVDIKLHNKFVCSATCHYTLTDMSNSVLLDNGTFSSKAFKIEQYRKEISLQSKGYGTNLYLYRLECANNYTALCPANTDTIIRKSLLVLSYKPSADQVLALQYLQSRYPVISENLKNSTIIHIGSENILDSVQFRFDKKGYYDTGNNLSALENDTANMLRFWVDEDYVSAMSFVEDKDIIERSQLLLSDSNAYNAYLYNTINNHNILLNGISDEYYLLDQYRSILLLNQKLSQLETSERSMISNILKDSNSFIGRLNTENYNYDALLGDALELRNSTQRANTIILSHSRKSLAENYALIYTYSGLLCSMLDDGDTESCLAGVYDDVIKIFGGGMIENNQTSNQIVNQSSNKDNYNNISGISSRFENFCDDASKTLLDLESGSTNTPEFSSENSSDSVGVSADPSIDSVEVLLLQYRFLSDYDISLRSLGYNVSLYTKVSAYKSYVADLLKDKYNISNPLEALSAGTYAVSDTLSLLSSYTVFDKDNLLFLGLENVEALCDSGSNDVLPEINAITTNYYNIPSFAKPIVNITPAPETIPKCCIYNICQSCEENNTHNPLILLHGHSFNQDIHAYRSIDIFDGFEYAFMDDKEYYLAGLLIPSGNASEGILGRYPVPVISKATYYLEMYNDLLGFEVSESKTENIDTYALRLKESVDYTLYVTGNDKVDIVAHSMGGLVVRKYMQVFGTEKIGTVILIGTPNNGVGDKTYNLCKVFGANLECEDMRSDSLFIKKLSDPLDQPDFSNMYLVVGRGCDTEGIDGDGVVTVNSSVISGFPEDHILYIDRGDMGCSVTKVFHQDLLNTRIYPEVYEFVKDKLE
ncbi:MAG: esterase/lipase family protein [Candidatus Woesearchaeota archaeon]